MFYSTLLLAAAALCGLVTAQNGTFSTSGPLTIDPNSVPIDTRNGWCIGQRGNCPLACGGSATKNSCDAVRTTPTHTHHTSLTPAPDEPNLPMHLHRRQPPELHQLQQHAALLHLRPMDHRLQSGGRQQPAETQRLRLRAVWQQES